MALSAKLERLRWYGARLSAMSAGEIVHRFKEKVHKRQLASHVSGWEGFAIGSQAGSAALDGLSRKLALMPANTVCDWLKAPRHLGRSWNCAYPLGTTMDGTFWFFDPVSGAHWPGDGVSCFKVDVRSTSSRPHGLRPFGDVKYVWEPNRLQVLMPLAVRISRALTCGDMAGAQDDLQLALGLLDSWMAANPPYQGVNWASGIEIAMRICSVTFLSAAIQNIHDEATAQHRVKLSQFIAAHAYLLAQLPSLHSSANNHRVAEGLGLFLAGLCMPDPDHRLDYAREGRHILESETLLQICVDGVGAEQSPTYQAFTMELIGFGVLMAHLDGRPFAHSVLERLQAGAGFLAALQFGEGRMPAIGDDDEGRAITNPAIEEPLYAASVCASISALTDAKCSTSRPGYFREALFGCADASASEAQCSGLKHFETGGYSVVTSRVMERDIHLVFDHGPLGYLALAAHGHADALAIWLAVDGKPTFVDAGTFLYHSGEDMRRVIRRSDVHNTLSLPGLSQSEPSAAFSWRNKARAHLLEGDFFSDDHWHLDATHDGYFKRAGVIHRRTIRSTDSGFVICDALEGARDTRAVEIGFLCDPGTRVSQANGVVSISRPIDGREDLLLLLHPPVGFTAYIQGGDVSADLAFVSPSFGEMRPAVRILLTGELGAQACEIAIELAAPKLVHESFDA